jgi:hypothetical protein
MERQIVLAVNHKYYTRRKVNNEIDAIKRMLPYVESFKAFCDNNGVFDVDKRNVIKNHNRLVNMYRHGFNANAFVYVVGKN